MALKTAEPVPQSVDRRELHVVYEITPGSVCPLTTVEDETEVIDVRMQFCEGNADCESTVEASGETEDYFFITHNTCDGRTCPGQAFAKYDAIPSVKNVSGGTMTVEAYLDDRSDLRDLNEALQGHCDSASLIHVKENSSGRLSDELTDVDLSVLTTKQREALDVAIKMGYYEDGSTVTLADMAEPFEISRQAFSERLSAVERKIIKQLSL